MNKFIRPNKLILIAPKYNLKSTSNNKLKMVILNIVDNKYICLLYLLI